MNRRSVFAICLGWGSLPLLGQIYPVPIPGGDIIPPFVTQFLPGPGLDGLNAEPHGIINFNGVVAMGYTSGTATDGTHTYNIGTDIRVYQGTFVGATPVGGAGGSSSAVSHGTFVEI
jgi:hypothetical protein